LRRLRTLRSLEGCLREVSPAGRNRWSSLIAQAEVVEQRGVWTAVVAVAVVAVVAVVAAAAVVLRVPEAGLPPRLPRVCIARLNKICTTS
jgi:anti-sigma-K factor RskA